MTRAITAGILLLGLFTGAACKDDRSKQVPQLGSASATGTATAAAPAPVQRKTSRGETPRKAAAPLLAKHITLPESKAGSVVRPAAAATPQATNVAGVTIKRAVFAKRIEGREPVGPATSFSHADTPKVWVFLELENATPDTLTLDVRWESAGSLGTHPVQLTVPKAKRWRTQAFISTDKKPGKYRCVIRTEKGAVLFDQPVEITA